MSSKDEVLSAAAASCDLGSVKTALAKARRELCSSTCVCVCVFLSVCCHVDADFGRDVHLDMEDDQKVYLKVEEDELEPLRQICVVGAPVACPEKPPPAAAAASVACPEKPPPAAAATGSGQETAERLFSFMLHFHSHSACRHGTTCERC